MTAAPAARSCYVSAVRLAAVLTAVSASRAFIRQTLHNWRLPAQVDAAELVVSELVTNAVKSTGVTDPDPGWTDLRAHHVVGVQLRAMEAGLYVEVWDGGSGSPTLQEPALEAEGGRGLFLLNAVSQRWGVHHPGSGGKVVWARLPLAGPPNPAAALQQALPPCGPGGAEHAGGPGELEGPDSFFGCDAMADALTQRAVDGLRGRRLL